MHHPLAIFSGSNSTELALKISKYVGCDLGEAENEPFSNGESHLRIKSDVRNRDVFIVQSVSRKWMPNEQNKHSGVNDCLVELLLWFDALARASAWRITAVIPYFGYARQDRKAEGRTPISARVMATCFEAAGCHRVLTMDLHSDQIQGFFSPKTILDHLNASNLFADYFTKLNLSNAVVLSPDVGNLKKADKYRQKLPKHYDLAVIDKRRNPDGTVEAKRIIGDVKDKSVILIDDIISTASTMRSAIELSGNKENGAKEFYVAATHGEFVGRSLERLKHPKVKRIVVTDSIPNIEEISQSGLPIDRISIGELFGEAITRIHKGDSLSSLC